MSAKSFSFRLKSFHILILICLFYFNKINAFDVKYCDSLIKSGVDAMWKKEHVKSLEILTEARVLAEKNKWYKQMFFAVNNIGGNYYLMLDYGEALNQYLESYKIAIKYLDKKHEIVVLNNIGILYSKEKKYDKAEEYFSKAYSIAKQIKDSVKIGYYAVNLGSLANERGKLLRARHYLNESLQYLKNHPEANLLAQIALAENELLSGNPEIARLKAKNLLNNLKTEKNKDNKIVLNLIVAKTYLNEGKTDKALGLLKEVLNEKPDLEKKKELFELLSNVYFEQRFYELAFQYKDSVNTVDNKFNDIKNGQLFQNSEVKFRFLNYKNEMEEKNSELRNERKFFYMSMLIFLLITGFLLFIYRNQILKNKQIKLISERNSEIMEFKLQKEIDDNLLSKEQEKTALLEQERLKKEIELRNQRISAKALYLSGRDQLLQEILKSLSKVPELSENKSVVKHINALKNHLKIDDDWDTFIRHFEEVNRGFLKNLTDKHPQLTQNDIRYISYVYMNLNAKEIASMLNITLEACRKRKERIIDRLGLPETISLNDYLLGF